MKISYDKSSDALSIVFKKERISKDIQLSPNVFAGLTRSGDLVEIQILEVSRTESPWFTLEAAAKYLGKSERTLLRWIKSGQLKSKKIGKEYRILPEDLDKLAS
ncbi:MAG: helix-turn-helix domain-containing protein [Deltaproteobacteria bacterium]|nr:helix-turn-helix domain-containing protein [Deltaproteobacteria bacterium]